MLYIHIRRFHRVNQNNHVDINCAPSIHMFLHDFLYYIFDETKILPWKAASNEITLFGALLIDDGDAEVTITQVAVNTRQLIMDIVVMETSYESLLLCWKPEAMKKKEETER